ncbi:MAG TPA: non-ribosomal peptide synthase/polyketide synthase [Paenibacillus sp.]|jgi:amino acid adenylation domain-containing protein
MSGILDIYGLSPLQKGMLFHTLYDHHDEHSASYLTQLSFQLVGSLDMKSFEQAWKCIVHRYEVFRTVFEWESAEEPFQAVLQEVAFAVRTEDWTSLSKEALELNTIRLMDTDRSQGFRLDEAPLMRVTVIKEGVQRFRVIWTYHHLLLDGWSVPLVLSELFSHYQKITTGEILDFPNHPSYKTYIHWLREQDNKKAEHYWRKELEGFVTPTPLEMMCRDSEKSYGYGESLFYLTEEQTRIVGSWARTNQITLNTVIQGAWAYLLSQYSGEDDVVYGVTSSGRPPDLSNVEKMVGLFISTLPSRVQISRQAAIGEWLRELQIKELQRRQYEYTSLIDIQGWSDVPRGIPLFQSLYVFENYPIDFKELIAGLEVSQIEGREQTNYPLNLIVTPSNRISLKFMYDRSRFDEDTVNRIYGHFVQVLNEMTVNQKRTFAEIIYLTSQEHKQLIEDWNQRTAEDTPHSFIHKLFEQQVVQNPDEVAVEFEDTQLTYKELNERANQLAHYLQKRGVAPESLVGIYVGRSLDMIIGLLGILKAGGAYVPLDPTYPVQRLQYIVRDAGITVMVTQDKLRDYLPECIELICIDEVQEQLIQESADNPSVKVNPENLAYVIYTSGTTGNPKGAMITHSGLVNYIWWAKKIYIGEEQLHFPLYTSIAFDLTVTSIYVPLISGNRIIVYGEGDPLLILHEIIQDCRVGIIKLTPAHMKALEDVSLTDGDSVLQKLIVGGEKLTTASARKIYHKFNQNLKIFNEYGPTETTVGCMTYLFDDNTTGGDSVPIGVPGDNVSIYLLDAFLKPVPHGVNGEMYISGHGLARGYLNRIELTEERFVPNPFVLGERMYKTGDIARWLTDGNLEYVDRIDNQVKIRGFRIELGEIEAVLNQYHTVKQAVVVAREDVPGDKRLVAYIVAKENTGDIETWREHAKAQLPSYMIPAHFVKIEEFTLTSNGKIDTKALPIPIVQTSKEQYTALRTPSEELLASIWSQVLGIETIGAHDSFFELGGHSILATQAVSRIREAFDIDLPLRELFEHTTIEALAERITLLRQVEKGLNLPSLQPVNRGEKMPLSYAQQRLWFLDRLDPNSALYNIPNVWRFKGIWDISILEQRLNDIFERHEMLRTIIQEHGGVPMQLIQDYEPRSWSVIDLTHLSASEKEVELERLMGIEVKASFDLLKGPLIRAQWIQMDSDDWVFLSTMHHIISDGWSMDIFMREWLALYEASLSGEAVRLSSLPVQYADFAVWQKDLLKEEEMERQLQYWKDLLSGDMPVLQLPTDRPRPSVQTYRGAMHHVILPEVLHEQLKALSRQENVTLFMTLLAAYQGFLSRYTGQEDILVGSPISNRNYKDLEGIIGFFVNTLVYRADVSNAPTFQELLTQVRYQALQAHDHQDVPFEKIVEAVQPERSMSYSPIFQTMFNWVSDVRGLHEWQDRKLVMLESPVSVAKFDLTVTMGELNEGLAISFEYNMDLFDSVTIARMAEHFGNWLKEVSMNSEEPLGSLEFMSEPEQNKMLEAWNDTVVEYPQGLVIDLIEEQAARYPDDVAITFGAEQLTYQELSERSNRLAHYLQKRGIKPEKLVGICVERSLEMIVGVIAILKAGGAYVPMDPTYPQQRLQYMLQDSGITLVVTQDALKAWMPEGTERVCLDRDNEEIAKESSQLPINGATPKNLAYVIYTSGSTGNPKGVLIENNGLCNLVMAQIELFRMNRNSRVIQFASFSFDAAVSEMFTSLVAGASLYIGNQEDMMPVQPLTQFLKRNRITHATLPPAVLGVLDEAGFTDLEVIISAGSACTGEIAKRWSHNRVFINAYGPTEATICATGAVYNGVEQPPIGRPIANTKVYVLANNLQPMPVGVAGELYIGGVGVARGYLNRPDLTAEKFILSPFGNHSAGRLYRTGDLVKFLPTGDLVYLGRIDNQVKIRGFRIELGEIEAVLSKHPSVKEVAVIARENGSGDKQLLAYVVVSENEGGATTWREYVKSQLPSYMVPAHFIKIEEVPLTPNGKVDTKALPDPVIDMVSEHYVAPHTPVGQLIASIWSQILGIEKVGAHESFFELGGHSLLATQVVSRLREAFDVDLPLYEIFEHATIGALAERVEQLRTGENKVHSQPLEPDDRVGQIPLSYAQQRLWFLNRLDPNSASYNIASAWRLKGTWNIEALQGGLNQLIERHEVLRTVFQEVDGVPVQEINDYEWTTWSVTDITHLLVDQREAKMKYLVQSEAEMPFDLGKGPLIRTQYIQMGAEECVLLCTMHHIISDAWSMDILLKEWLALYEAALNGTSALLQPLPVQYADFAKWQRKWLQEEVMERQLHYWQEQLSGDLPVLQLPIDRPRPSIQTHRGAMYRFVLPATLLEQLNVICRQENVTLFMMLLAAYQGFLSRYTGQEDILIGCPIANRNHKKIEGLIGFFVNTLVYRTNVTGNESFKELLAQVRQQALQAYEHQDVPFEKIVEVVQPERSMSHSPIFQTMFSWQTDLQILPRIPGRTIEVIENSMSTAKFDLTLTMGETEDGIGAAFEYNTDLFDVSTITRLAEHFKEWLKEVSACSEVPLASLEIMSEEERKLMLTDWNRTTVEYPHGGLIQELIEEHSRCFPEAIAVVSEGGQLNYRQLNERSNRLAHYLQKQGVGPERLVGICVDKSLEMIVGIMGILKAGGAYVPLDPTYPTQRLLHIVQDASIELIVTRGKLQDWLPEGTMAICLDENHHEIEEESSVTPISGATSENLAYVIYTSGSTGKPKGVLLEQQGLCNLAQSEKNLFKLNMSSRVIQFASFSFDTSVSEIFTTLVAGATLYLGSKQDLMPVEPLTQFLQENHISHATLPPAVLNLLHASIFPDLQVVISAGSTCTEEIAREWSADRLFINAYGPTEITVCASAAIYNGSGIPNIGRPYPNKEVYVLDQNRKPVPIGVAGEMYIGGTGLARGYLNLTKLTKERFIPNPFSHISGARIYRTGDLVKYLPNGDLEYIGRIDNQVKIRGFRIELGEIEAVLSECSTIKQVVVMAREDKPGDKQLVAYIVGEGNPTDWRECVKEQLPNYMVPAYFVKLDSVPLTHNGKVDTKALPVPIMKVSGKNYIVPRTSEEQLLASVWVQVLGVEQVGIYDSFFELGGHSLLATQAVSRIREAFDINMPLRDLFEYPMLESLASRIVELQQKDSIVDEKTIMPADREDHIPLSYAQRRLWFIDRLEPNSAIYNIPSAWYLTGNWDIEALHLGLNAMIDRHEVLRTVIYEHNGVPMQRILTYEPRKWTIIDISQLSAKEREVEIKRLMVSELEMPFNLQEGPLIRVQWVRIKPEEYVLLCSMHHIISDGWSMSILMREWLSLYESAVKETPSSLLPLPIQYADFAKWQRDWLKDEVMERQLQYWKEVLAGDLPVLQLPTDRARPSIQTYRGAIHHVVLSASLLQQLQVLSRQENTTLFMTLLAAYQGFLSRYTGQKDILVGSPIANRNHREIEGLIGFFSNTIVYRADVTNSPTFKELLNQVRQQALQAYEHQDVPFEKVVEMVQPERSMSYSPIFQTLFNWQMDIQEMPDWLDRRMEVMDSSISISKFDLTVTMGETEDGLGVSFEYNTDLFNAATVERMAIHLENWLKEVCSNPEISLSSISLMDEAERNHILEEWNDTRVENPKEYVIQDLVEAQTVRCPESLAVIFEEQQLTYRELNNQANQLAHFLQKRGVGAETLVGICMERSLNMIIGLLGILKAGGAYVPLDPTYPEKRLQTMLQDAGIKVIVTQEGLQELLPTELEFVCLDRDYELIAKEIIVEPSCGINPENLAYVIYTSGSTGKPKGVSMPHRALVNLLLWQLNALQLSNNVRTLQFTSLNFDVSFQEIFSTLASGGTLVLISEETRRDPACMLQYVIDNKVGRIFVPFVALDQFAQEVSRSTSNLAELKEVITAGEQLRLTPDIIGLMEKVPDMKLHNHYGPSETHVVTSYTLTGDKSSWPLLPPIGGPINNVQLYILDENNNLVPIGVAGQLYVAGHAVARGYFNNNELTKDRFIKNPFSDDPCSILYRTGDLVRWLPDGNVEYLGRMDSQVKIRGFRIELGEIEAVLSEHSDVKQVAVVALENTPSSKQLVAYVVGDGVEATWREHIKDQLPSYMIPAHIVELDVMPLTPNGKIDKNALPAPNLQSSAGRYISPRTPMEELVASVWSQVLGIERIGAHDSFFELGGHSLLATQVVSRLREAFDIELSLRELFEYVTVESLAERTSQLRQSEKGMILPLLNRAERVQQLPLSYAQQRLWFLDRFEPNSAVYNIPIAWRLSGNWDIESLQHSLNAMIERHEALRTVIQEHDGLPVQLIQAYEPRKWNLTDLTHLPSLEEREKVMKRLLQIEEEMPFDLGNGPLIRAEWIRMDEEEWVLLCTMHHIISDGWSLDIFVCEWLSLYEAITKGEVAQLSPLPVQYVDFAIWQRSWLKDEIMDRQLMFWQEKLAGDLPVLQLPTDRPRPSIQTYQGATHHFIIPASLSEKIKALSRQENATLFMTLLAAYQGFLSRYTGQKDILVGSPIANRKFKEIEGLIGFFVNTLVYRADITSNPSFKQLLAQVRQQALDAHEHQDVPFEKVVETVQPQRSMSHSPIFQTMFNWKANVPSLPDLSGKSMEWLESSMSTAKFDLTLGMGEVENGLGVSFEYNTDLFNDTTIERMARHFEHWLQQVSDRPEQPIESLDLMSKIERLMVLEAWNDTQMDYLQASLIHELIEEQSICSPKSIAIVFDDVELTYQELNERANQLAHWLQKRGVGPECLVGICVERSLDMVIGLLGIMKAGGAYVPLDPTYPKQRIQYMLHDAGIEVMIAQKAVRNILPEGINIVCLDRDRGQISQESKDAPTNRAIPENLAYVIYTSGSTGNPKGVMLEHGSLLNFMHAMNQHFTLTADDVWFAATSISFDISILEIFFPLISGASVVLASREQVLNGGELASLVQRSHTTYMQATPMMWRTLLDSGYQPADHLTMLVGGEMLPLALAQDLTKSGGKLFNMFGPTESTIWSTMWQVNPDRPVLIGRPICNTEVYILDHRFQPVPIGVAGELYIGGAGLARGYLNRLELTAERFVENPFRNHINDRLYRTGDLAKYLPDGNLEYIGRIDSQVKIRGFRIELGEIEVVLSQHPDVKQAIVLAGENELGHKQLIAYVTGVGDAKVLRNHVKQHLPSYMVPAIFVEVDVMPLTPNNKIDRKALSTSNMKVNTADVRPMNPRDNIEFELINIWKELLSVENITIKNDFFELGGHSLLAIKLLSQIKNKWSINIQAISLFQNSTIENLAVLIREKDVPQNKSEIVIKLTGTTDNPFFCVHPAGGNIYCYTQLARMLDGKCSFYGLQSPFLEEQFIKEVNLEEIVELYLKEIIKIQPIGPYRLGGWSLGGAIAYEMARKLIGRGETVSLLVLMDTMLSKGSGYEYSEEQAISEIEQIIFDNILASNKPGFTNIKERYAYVLEQAKLQEMIPQDADIRTIERLVNIYRYNTQLLSEHHVEEYGSKVIYFNAEEGEDLSNDWSVLLKEKVKIYNVSGKHADMMSSPAVEIIAERLAIEFNTSIKKNNNSEETPLVHGV